MPQSLATRCRFQTILMPNKFDREWWGHVNCIHSSAFITRSNITWYHYYSNRNKISIRWTHKVHPISRPDGRAIWVSFVVIWGNIDRVLTASRSAQHSLSDKTLFYVTNLGFNSPRSLSKGTWLDDSSWTNTRHLVTMEDLIRITLYKTG